MRTIAGFTLNTVDAISRLVKCNLYTQALIILYSAIDTLAWANLPNGDVTPKDFIDWVDIYIEPEKELGCTAEDLYGARYGLLHSSASESSRSRKGEASEIWYATSPDSISSFQEYAKQVSGTVKVVYFTDLLEEFVSASQKFWDEIAIDKIRQESVNERIQRCIIFVPTSTVTKKKD